MIALKINKRWLMGIITLCCFVFLAVHQNYFVTGDYGFIRGLACFNLGYFVFKITAKPFHLPNYFEVFIGGLIILLMYVYHMAILNHSKSVLGIQFLIPIAFATGIVTLIKTNGLLSKILQTKPLMYLGKISYSVYLNQALIIGYFIPKLYKWVNWSQGETKKTICVVLLLIILIIYSWGTQFIIENKLGKKLASWGN
jgi:peptidoglycan/LPS O-acetylase OafA/YrhL